jgi:hypothetical protein
MKNIRSRFALDPPLHGVPAERGLMAEVAVLESQWEAAKKRRRRA